eukprot:TRINITY_DN50481_c0_g1_i1.p2 TRINITY_DN50481_c0_g1~~TRINITY_DN50481_c0_g1_i1.p2  ORF type:complete len:152 (+),score=24.27 TRINITY_DN50481_c0_g1_i1:139-594(+)
MCIRDSRYIKKEMIDCFEKENSPKREISNSLSGGAKLPKDALGNSDFLNCSQSRPSTEKEALLKPCILKLEEPIRELAVAKQPRYDIEKFITVDTPYLNFGYFFPATFLKKRGQQNQPIIMRRLTLRNIWLTLSEELPSALTLRSFKAMRI